MQPPGEAERGTNSVTGLASRDRVRAFELAAGLSVLFMIAVHDLWHWGSPATWTTPIGTVISLLGGPTATPVFLFVMAASLAFSPGLTARALVTRGLWLLFLGYVLNVLRGVIPATLGMAAGLVTQQQIWPFTPWWLLTSVDLHHVTGLSLILLGL
ncbi:MAG TPA: heparan-alpha-glucosaminide N-acetyltransferase domain-containing protein, partial [Candidatus Binatus sp.]|nr:heparan-alpha-glucosaminide N-acetyltransferase domain-containing protein [Candidatus Binatus sp.]